MIDNKKPPKQASVLLQELAEKQRLERRLKIDQHTANNCAALVTSTGFSHYELSLNTQVPMNEREMHSLVAEVCEQISRKIFTLAGCTEEEATERMREVSRQTYEWRVSKGKSKLNLVSPGRGNVGSVQDEDS